MMEQLVVTTDGNNLEEKSMSRKYMVPALVCAVSALFSGCIEENFENITPAQKGDEIIFGARAGFENSKSGTKTEYSGVTYDVYYDADGNIVEAGTAGATKKTFERIDWVDETDMIEIHCPEAVNGTTAHYVVNHMSDADETKDYAYLTRVGDSSLQWGEGSTITDDKGNTTEGVHHFYAMYPSSEMFSIETTLNQGIKMDGVNLTGIIPAAQSPIKIEKDGNDYIAYPDMRYAYMAAKGTASKDDGKVSLTFVPVVTAVQIQLILDSGDFHPVEIAEIAVQGTGITGEFSADLSKWNSTYPPCLFGNGGSNVQISVSDKETLKPLTLNPGESLTFTIFLRPGTDYSNLGVGISPTGSAYMGKQMQGITIPQNLKTRITSFRLPKISTKEEEIEFDASNWMEQVEPQTEFKKLSIPGTSGSFSYLYTADKTGNFRSQHTHMTLDEQWKAGIRAFEIVSDRAITKGSFIIEWEASQITLAEEQVTCNKANIGITVGKAMEGIRDLVRAHKEECAVVIFTYQPEGNLPNRNATSYAKSIQLWYDSIDYKDMFKRYTPDIKLSDAKGKILVFVRPNQKDENDNGSFDGAKGNLSFDNYPFVLIDGCGTGKDKWGARGYTINGNPAPNISNGKNNYVESYMNNGFIDPTSVTSSVRRGDMNFGYTTNDENVTCWFQEWARVIENQTNIPGGNWSDGRGSYPYPAMYWFESYNEKKFNAIETFNMAISNQHSSFIFINSLSGYIAETADAPTYSLVPSVNNAYGGDGGNVKALADRLNPDFYRHVYEAGIDQATGPTGIVMMDYVTDKPDETLEFDGSYRLPGLIISNNRKFGTGNSNNAGNGGQNDNQNPGGNSGGNTGGSGNQGGGNGGEDAM